MSLNSKTLVSYLLYPAIWKDLSRRRWSWNSALTMWTERMAWLWTSHGNLSFASLGTADGPLSSGDQFTSHGPLHLSSFFTPERAPPPTPTIPFYSRTTCLTSFLPPGPDFSFFPLSLPFLQFHFHCCCRFASSLFFIIYQFLLLFLLLPPFIRFLFRPSCTTRTLLLLSLFTSVWYRQTTSLSEFQCY